VVDGDAVQQRFDDLIPDAVGELVTAWTVVVDTITDDGEKATWYLTARGQTPTTTLGHARWVDHKIAAAVIADRLDP